MVQPSASLTGDANLLSALEHDPDAAILLDEELRYVFVNPAAATWSQREPKDFIGRRLWEVFPGTRGSRLEVELRRAVASRKPVHFDHEASTRTGNCYEISVIPLTTGVLFRARNVTELRRAQALGAAQQAVLARMGSGAPLVEVLTVLAHGIEASSTGDGLCAVRVTDLASQTLRCVAAPSVPHHDFSALAPPWSTPIVGSDGAVLGMLDVYNREAREPSEADKRTVRERIHLAAVAIERARATETLERNEKQFRALFAQWPAGIILYDRDLRVTDCNEAFARMLNVKRELMMGASLDAALDRRPLAVFRESVQGRSASYDGPYESLQRGKIWLSLRSTPLHDADGRLTGGMTTIADLTELREAEDAARSSERSLAHARRMAGIGSWEWSPRTGKTIWSPEVYRMFEVEPGTVEPSVDAWLPRVHPHDRPRVDRTLALIRSGEREHELEMRVVTSSGETRFVEVHAEMVIDDDGTPRLLGTIHDVSVRKRAEAERRRAEEILRATLESSPLAIVSIGVDSRIATWNAAAERTFGWTAAEAIGQSILMVVPEWNREDTTNLIACVREGREGIGGRHREAKRMRKNGEIFDASVSLAPLRDASGAFCGCVAVIADLTEQKRLEAELRQAQKMEAIGRLAGGVAHDFNNLLTVIVTTIEILLAADDVTDETRGDLHVMQMAADRASSLTRQLLAFGRRQVVKPTLVDLNALVTDLEKMIRRVIREDIDLVVTAKAASATVMADRGQLEQVLMNLAVNARDAMPSGGTLSIVTENAANLASDADADAAPGVALCVRDTGIGMSEATLARIFEPFFTTKEQGKGTGLGLSTVYGIVKQCGGRIHVESAPLQGAAFTIRLPAAAHDSSASSPAALRRSLVPLGAETILVVEDEDLVRKIVCQVLTRAGYRVLEAANGEEALALCARGAQAIDLVLTDVIMPKMSGRDLVERIHVLSPRTRCLYMSGYADDVLGDHAALANGTPFLPKPFTPDLLTKTVRDALQ